MEDAHLILPSMTEDSNLFAIFDGHGGIKYLIKFFLFIIVF